MERSLDLVVSLLGVLKAGGDYLPLDPASAPGRLVFMLEDAGARVRLTDDASTHCCRRSRSPPFPGLDCLDVRAS
jgi:non-ribosomal peptide synthetase component F